MSNTPKFALRKPYSIREELDALNPFVRREQTGAMQPYTMADIEAAEKRLNFQLPAPIRDLYLTMGDYLCLQNEFYFRALELLRWDGDYLLLMHGLSDNLGFGLRRDDPNATVYEWICDELAEDEDDDDDEDFFGNFEDDFELCRHRGDVEGMQEACADYFAFWQENAGRSEIIPETIRQNTHAPFTFFWDAFIVRHALSRMVDDAYILDEAKMTAELDQFYISNDLPSPPSLQSQIAPPFVPLSEKLELITDANSQEAQLIQAYINREDDCLLLTHPDGQHCYYLLTKQPVPYSFAQSMEEKCGLRFHSRNGSGQK